MVLVMGMLHAPGDVRQPRWQLDAPCVARGLPGRRENHGGASGRQVHAGSGLQGSGKPQKGVGERRAATVFTRAVAAVAFIAKSTSKHLVSVCRPCRPSVHTPRSHSNSP